MSGLAELTAAERMALALVRDGADVYSHALAHKLRIIECDHPELIHIGKRQTYTGDGTDQMPYFGAIASDEGIALLDSCDDLPPCVGAKIRDITYEMFRRECGQED